MNNSSNKKHYSIEKNNDIEYNDSNLDRSIVKQGELVNKFRNALTPNEWKIYSKKILEVMDNTYGDLNRTDVIGNKIISTTIKDAKEQITNVFTISNASLENLEDIIEMGNEYGYSGEKIYKFIETLYGKENVYRYVDTTHELETFSKSEPNS